MTSPVFIFIFSKLVILINAFGWAGLGWAGRGSETWWVRDEDDYCFLKVSLHSNSFLTLICLLIIFSDSREKQRFCIFCPFIVWSSVGRGCFRFPYSFKWFSSFAFLFVLCNFYPVLCCHQKIKYFPISRFFL